MRENHDAMIESMLGRGYKPANIAKRLGIQMMEVDLVIQRLQGPTCTCNWAKPAANEAERLSEMKRLLRKSAHYRDQTPGRGGITGMIHALRCAALAREESVIPESSFIGLVHDLARPLNDVHHGEIVAEIVRDRVSSQAYEILRDHGKYQAAIVHNTQWPSADDEQVGKASRVLALQELQSFEKHYNGPVLSLREADHLLDSYLA